MKRLVVILALAFYYLPVFSQPIDGDRLLDLLGKPVTDPLFQQLKTQEVFYTDSWDQAFSIYIGRSGGNDMIDQVELQNGKLRYGSQQRYGFYRKSIPLGLSWSMTKADFSSKFGAPDLVSTNMGFNDYHSGNWKIRVFFENEKPVSIGYYKIAATVATAPAASKPATATPVASTTAQANWVIKIDTSNAVAQLNWPALRTLIISTRNLRPMIGKDSTDYIGEIYYATPYKAIGFERTAIKKAKKEERWYYEAFFKTSTDSNKVRDMFINLYSVLKKTIKDSTGDDFILASVAKMPISTTPMNWFAQWTLYSGYKGLVPGLEKVKVAVMLTGMTDFSNPGRLIYTIKFYVFDKDTKMDIFGWDQPR